MDIEQRRERAIKWLKILETEVHRLLVDDSVFHGYQAMLDDDRFSRVNGLFHVWVTSNFAQAAAVAVRRLAKKPKKGRKSDSVSLGRFLVEIRDNPDIVSRAHYLSLFEPSNPMMTEGLADGAFTYRAGEDNCIGTAIVEEQIERFDATARSLEDWVDKRLAHYDESGLKGKMPTFGELETAIRTLDEIVVFIACCYWQPATTRYVGRSRLNGWSRLNSPGNRIPRKIPTGGGTKAPVPAQAEHRRHDASA